MKYSFYLIVLMATLFSIDVSAQQPDLNQFKIFCGLWKMQNGKEQIFEEWSCIKPEVFTGRSYSINENADTIVSEKLKLVLNSNQVFYIPQVIGQNNDLPIPFKLTLNEENHWTFVNKSHDFPQEIEYIFIPPDKLKVRISGSGKNGKLKKIDYNFVRIN